MDIANPSFCSKNYHSQSFQRFSSLVNHSRNNYNEALRSPANDGDTPEADPVDVDVASKMDGLQLGNADAREAANKSTEIKGPPTKAAFPVQMAPFGLARCLMEETAAERKYRAWVKARDAPGHRSAALQRPFHKWMKTIKRRATQRSLPSDISPRIALYLQQRDPAREADPSAAGRGGHHRKSSSGSSYAFVAAVRSASASMASVSAVGRPRRMVIRSQRLSSTECSSRTSLRGARASEDSAMPEPPGLSDAAAIERSLRRRQILEELIGTEEAYISDVRFLMNVYVTILASLPCEHMGLRSSINRTLTDIVELHEEILGELHRTVPHSEYTQLDLASPISAWLNPGQGQGQGQGQGNQGHRRWTSITAVPEHPLNSVLLEDIPGMLTEPQVVAEVAKIFAKKINRLFIYEEYGAAYEIMIRDIASAEQVMPDWNAYQKGIEALAQTLGSDKSHKDGPKKCLTTSDLLVKPIQRICKYPLLFSELLKYTPVSDCPNSHMEVDSVLTRLREATAEINRASDDVGIKMTLEKTWLLQDRLAFPDRKLDAFSKKQIRSFGHVRLCGVLHVSWQTTSWQVQGQYMMCLLYRDVLCLASAGKFEPIYTILACINVNEVGIEEADNGRGLQCLTAPFSWKIVFECDHQMHEMIMTACSANEEKEWRSRLSRPPREHPATGDRDEFSSIYLDIKSMGPVFGKPGTTARLMSIEQATAVGPKSPICQVNLKNTSFSRDAPTNTEAASIIRSQSMLHPSLRDPVLAPPRSERARLEALMADVWSREVLPFPGMTARSRSESIVKNSASSVIRKLSVASIASSLTKRSGHLAQRNGSAEHAAPGEGPKRRDLGPDAAKPDGAKCDGEKDRGAKRQRTGDPAKLCKAGEKRPGALGCEEGAQGRRGRTASGANRTGTLDAHTSRSLSSILSKRATDARKTGSVSKVGVEKVEKFHGGQAAGAQRSEVGGSLRRFFTMKRDR